MELELLAWGFGLVEGPRTDADGTLWFTDVYGGTVHRRTADGTVETVLGDRPMAGGLALHADGGFVVSGPDISHWRDGVLRRIHGDPAITHWNDIQPDAAGRLYIGSVRSDLTDLKGPKTPGEAYRVELDGTATELYGGIEVTNGIGFSPDGRTLYHADSTSKGIWVHDLAPDGSVANRRHIGRTVFERGIPDGLCVDVDGNLWVAHVGPGRVAKLSPSGDLLDEIPVPAKAVTSCAFGGADHDELYIVTADNTDDPAKAGSIFRCRPGVAGVPTSLCSV
ncbi:MAG: SMP-30/gluconolactonase/LRE family protein [Actinobacteria bacterium]|nr:SMP-30/gluconolactonase/LRE family protein [Actinomycetota bacterium]